MFWRKGISVRHGPHQLAQKFSITTWPLYFARSTVPPPFWGTVNSGAGPFCSAATAGSATTMAATIPAIRFFMAPPTNSFRNLALKEYGRADPHLDVVGELRGTQEIGLEYAILDCDVDRQPVAG